MSKSSRDVPTTQEFEAMEKSLLKAGNNQVIDKYIRRAIQRKLAKDVVCNQQSERAKKIGDSLEQMKEHNQSTQGFIGEVEMIEETKKTKNKRSRSKPIIPPRQRKKFNKYEELAKKNHRSQRSVSSRSSPVSPHKKSARKASNRYDSINNSQENSQLIASPLKVINPEDIDNPNLRSSPKDDQPKYIPDIQDILFTPLKNQDFTEIKELESLAQTKEIEKEELMDTTELEEPIPIMESPQMMQMPNKNGVDEDTDYPHLPLQESQKKQPPSEKKKHPIKETENEEDEKKIDSSSENPKKETPKQEMMELISYETNRSSKLHHEKSETPYEKATKKRADQGGHPNHKQAKSNNITKIFKSEKKEPKQEVIPQQVYTFQEMEAFSEKLLQSIQLISPESLIEFCSKINPLQSIICIGISFMQFLTYVDSILQNKPLKQIERKKTWQSVCEYFSQPYSVLKYAMEFKNVVDKNLFHMELLKELRETFLSGSDMNPLEISRLNVTAAHILTYLEAAFQYAKITDMRNKKQIQIKPLEEKKLEKQTQIEEDPPELIEKAIKITDSRHSRKTPSSKDKLEKRKQGNNLLHSRIERPQSAKRVKSQTPASEKGKFIGRNIDSSKKVRSPKSLQNTQKIFIGTPSKSVIEIRKNAGAESPTKKLIGFKNRRVISGYARKPNFAEESNFLLYSSNPLLRVNTNFKRISDKNVRDMKISKLRDVDYPTKQDMKKLKKQMERDVSQEFDKKIRESHNREKSPSTSSKKIKRYIKSENITHQPSISQLELPEKPNEISFDQMALMTEQTPKYDGMHMRKDFRSERKDSKNKNMNNWIHKEMEKEQKKMDRILHSYKKTNMQ